MHMILTILDIFTSTRRWIDLLTLVRIVSMMCSKIRGHRDLQGSRRVIIICHAVRREYLMTRITTRTLHPELVLISYRLNCKYNAISYIIFINPPKRNGADNSDTDCNIEPAIDGDMA